MMKEPLPFKKGNGQLITEDNHEMPITVEKKKFVPKKKYFFKNTALIAEIREKSTKKKRIRNNEPQTHS
jgi:hypothetical protein